MQKGSYRKFSFILIFSIFTFLANASDMQAFKLDCKKNLVAGTTSDVEISLLDQDGKLLKSFHGNMDVLVNGAHRTVLFNHGYTLISLPVTKSTEFDISLPAVSTHHEVISIKKWPSFISILPPLFAILLAILFREVIVALCLGIFMGLIFILGMDHPLNYLLAPLRFIDTYLIGVLTDSSKISVIVFSMLIGGMVSLLIKNGSVHFLIQRLMRIIRNRKASLFSTWLLGILIFFDDYANTLIVGNAARTVTDKFKVSRQKLAYIVDSTAAPVASIALVTTWIGAQINYISDSVAHLGLSESPYLILLNSLAYAFYPFLTLFFILVLIRSGLDFGPMLAAERLAHTDFNKHLEVHVNQQPDSSDTTEFRSSFMDALIPIIGLILVAFSSLFYNESMSEILARTDISPFLKVVTIIGNGDPYRSMLWASFFGVGSALIITLIRRNINLRQSVESIVEGFKTMLIAMIILILAWVLGSITEELHTANFLADLLGNNVPVFLMPMLVFLLSAAIAFATGTSWGTMALLYPILLPAIYHTGLLNEMDHNEIMPFFHQVVAAVLGGSVFGDHCSPISDTTILSSMASSCNHIEHVKTQMPYALTVGFVSSVFGYFLVSVTGFLPIWSYLISAFAIILIIRLMGRKTVPG
ncbi:Na+/H+ antiporter NhaC family protein [Bacteroidota bacterium]